VKRLLALLVLAGALVAGFAWVHETKPAPYARLLYPLRYDAIVTAHAENYRLDPALLAAVIYQESKFRPDARSESGAIGLMQLLPDTAQGIADRTGGSRFVVDDLYDPELNVRYGAWYLRHLLDRYDDLGLALAAYNAGQTNVDGWLERGVGIQFAETRAYVEHVAELREIYARAYSELRSS
jgi:soluble lytic murein transglycosylase